MTSLSFEETRPHHGNPIDLVEEIVIANDWAHDRAGEDDQERDIEQGAMPNEAVESAPVEKLSDRNTERLCDQYPDKQRRDEHAMQIDVANHAAAFLSIGVGAVPPSGGGGALG